MQELTTMMRAIELQRAIEDKVSEWRQRSAKVTGKNMADSYQQPINFKRQINRRKHSAEINKIYAKYSKPINIDKNAGERHFVVQKRPSPPPIRPPRVKKQKNISKSADNLTNINLDTSIVGNRILKNKYETKSDDRKYNRHSLDEILDYNDFKDIENKKKINIMTSTPIIVRKSSQEESIEIQDFKKCSKYSASVNDLSDIRKGNSEPNILSASDSRESLDSVKTSGYKKKWKFLKKPFRKGTFDRFLVWKTKKPHKETTR